MKIKLLIFTLLVYSHTTFALTGAILDSSGQGIAGAKVTIVSGNQSQYTYSGRSGEFDLPNNSNSQITVSKSGFETKQINITSNQISPFNINLARLNFTLSGKVIDEEGEPVEGVTVSNIDMPSVITDEQGTFSFTVPAGSKYKLSASLEDYYLGDEKVGLMEGNVEHRILALLD